jgi:hypothetical protein
MSKALRLSEKWFHRGLWLVAVVFAGFLIGLGGTIVGDLPKVEQRARLDDFMDREATPRLRQSVKDAQTAARDAQAALEQAQLRQQVARADNQAARETFNNWLSTRQATARAEQDAELVARTARLDALRQAERTALTAVETQQQALLDARQAETRAQKQLQDLQDRASQAFAQAQRAQELRVFLYRLALTLPLLGLAAWLFKTRRHSTWWPFVWGFVFFAGFTFFVELVPYLPSYGGYVRYLVGIALTVIGGRYAIAALQRYLERQKQVEALPDTQRRQGLDYDLAQARLAKNVCPGCERPVDLKDGKTDFCPHCGLCLFDHCGHCTSRKSAFARFCFACGTPATAPGVTPASAPGTVPAAGTAPPAGAVPSAG